MTDPVHASRTADDYPFEPDRIRPIGDTALGAAMMPFNPESRCPKCGGQDVAAHWQKGHSCSRGRSCFEPERIERHCQTCRFEWDEAPLDGASSGQSRPPEGEQP